MFDHCHWIKSSFIFGAVYKLNYKKGVKSAKNIVSGKYSIFTLLSGLTSFKVVILLALFCWTLQVLWNSGLISVRTRVCKKVSGFLQVAVIIPYRNRFEQLKIFLRHLHPFLQRQQLMYRIIVVEQVFIFCFILNADHVFLKITKTERSEIKYAIRISV